MDCLTFEEARMMANVNHRSKRLDQDGYQAKRIDTHTVEISNADGEAYIIDEVKQSCTCPFYVKWNGKHSCKHLLGYPTLLLRPEIFPTARCTGVELQIPGTPFPLGTFWTSPKAWQLVGVSRTRLTDLVRNHACSERASDRHEIADIVESSYSIAGQSVILATEIPRNRTILLLAEEV